MEQTKIIFHIDVNSAFLSWSAVKQLKEDPSAVDLRTIPSIVGGDISTRHGVVTAKSIPAKKYGIRTGEPVAKALQKCPNLTIVRSDFDTYRAYSRQFIGILKKYSPVVEQASIDEAYADITPLWEAYSGPLSGKEYAIETAARIRAEIRETLGFTVNVGISSNKLLAKMASDFSKPDKTHTLYPDEIAEKMWPLPVDELYGCGAKTAEKLRTLGLLTIGDAAAQPVEMLKMSFGTKAAEYIHRSANGIGSDVVSDIRGDAKSYSNEITTASDITAANYAEEMPPLLKKLSEKVAGRMQKDNVFAFTIGVMAKTSEFRRHSMQLKLEDSVNDSAVLFRQASALMEKLCFGDSGLLLPEGSGLRLVGVSAQDMDDGSYRQMNLADLLRAVDSRASEPAKNPGTGPAVNPEPESGGESAADSGPESDKNPADSADSEKSARLREMSRIINARYGENTIRKGLSES